MKSDFAVVGMKYRFPDLRFQGIEFPWDRLRQQPLVRLEHEPANPHDANAIRVVLPAADGQPDIFIGYIPARNAKELCDRYVYQGKDFPAAVVTEVGTDSNPEKRGIKVFLDTEGSNS